MPVRRGPAVPPPLATLRGPVHATATTAGAPATTTAADRRVTFRRRTLMR